MLRQLICSSLFILVSAGVLAAEEAPRYNQVQFQVERSQAVDNDRMQAVLSITAENGDPAQLADQINRTMDWALKIAKTKPKLSVRTAAYRTHPVYDKAKIQRWNATQELILEGSDFAELGNLIGQLQARLQVASLNFSVSSTRRSSVESDLITQALAAFQQRAELVRKQLNASGHRLVNLNINTSGVDAPAAMMDSMALKSTAVAMPAVEAGTSTLSVSVNGTIELK